MKKISTLLLAFAFIFNVSASNADLFSYDLSEITTELSDLELVENVIAQNQNSTVEEINTQIINNNFLSSSFETNYNSSLALRAGLIDDMDWGSFAWGFCCWPVGFFVVITNKDKDSNQKKSFWIGLGTSFVLSLISGAGASA
ncbi:MAG: hypothetical protein CL837_01755 [Crocinitomicaceae bacterium]|nr:hypothetical protein [Crocinitomicaceae bacterium]